MIDKILQRNKPEELRALFCFNQDNTDDQILFKFNIWARFFFPTYFASEDAWFHEEINRNNIKAYRGKELEYFVNVAFRGAGKDVKTEIFLTFTTLNDQDHLRRYVKILSADIKNAVATVTGIYNRLVHPRIQSVYGSVFTRTVFKKEEKRDAFSTSTGVKFLAGTVGTEQRGSKQDEYRPDLIWFNDIENRKTLRSAVVTKSIWDNIEEARTGLQVGGSCIYTCNYISERGNVHQLITRTSTRKFVLIVPILNNYGESNWPEQYPIEAINIMKETDDDFEGERMCEPSAGFDIIFDRNEIDQQIALAPIREIAGMRIFHNYRPDSRYAGGMDVAGGVGLDSSSSVFIDFDSVPAQVVATYDNNEIKPDIFGDEIARQGERFGECLIAIEKNNHGHSTIGRLKQIYSKKKIFRTQPKATRVKIMGEKKKVLYEYGWLTNGVNKPNMMFDLAKAVERGHLRLNCKRLIAEARSYTRDDLMDGEEDVRLTTRHFDLLIACAIAYQMRNFVDISIKDKKALSREQEYQNKYKNFDPYAVL